MLKIPKEIEISGYTYKILFVDKLEDPDTPADKYMLGQCDPVRFEIKILKGQNKDSEMSTFIHECIEAINEHYAIEMKHRQIVAFENGMFQMLKNCGVIKT